MADRVAEAEARLVERMARARARVARERRRPPYVVPLGLASLGVLGASLMDAAGPFQALWNSRPRLF